MSIKHVLVVDDDRLSRQFLVETVRSLGYSVSQAERGAEALEQVRTEHVDLVLTDLRMPGTDGLTLAEALGRRAPGLPVVLVTAHGTLESAVQAIKSGAADYLLKPCTPDALELVLRRVDRTMRLRRENEYLRAEAIGPVDELVAESAAMRETLRAAGRIAHSQGTVLITGESGTGKECVARFIHRESDRGPGGSDGPLVRVNCAALSEELLDAELFGRERGAFPGARKARPGRFELADGGTLLLEEIGELPAGTQARLLRVLEEGRFERLGGTHGLEVDVRVIATTNHNLASEVAAGNFREDLYYRLHVLPIHMHPLRERAQDILPLAQHFVRYHAEQNGRGVPAVTPAAQLRLKQWSWPGNVRELEDVIQRAVVLLQGDSIDVADLSFGPVAADLGAGAPSAPVAAKSGPQSAHPLANRPLADIEREAILATLDCTGGNKTEAARRLGVSARTLSNKMKLWRQIGLVA